MAIIIQLAMLLTLAVVIAFNRPVHSAPKEAGQLEMADQNFDNSPLDKLFSTYFIRERAIRRKEIPKHRVIYRTRRSPVELSVAPNKINSTSTPAPHLDHSVKISLIKILQEFQMMRHELSDLRQTVAELRSTARLEREQHWHSNSTKCTQQMHYHLHYFPVNLYPTINGTVLHQVENISTSDLNESINNQMKTLKYLGIIPTKPLEMSPLEVDNLNGTNDGKENPKGNTDVVSSPLVSIISTSKPQASESKFPPIGVEDMIMATCRVRSNRHIALLNQQGVSGIIKIWQRRSVPGPVYMQVRLTGFKTGSPGCVLNANGTYCLNETEGYSRGNVTQELVGPIDDTVTLDFGMHVHELGDLSRDCQSTGTHYNPFKMTHGGPFDKVKHLGDLGNIHSTPNGTVSQNLTFDHISLVGEHSIMDRSIVIRNQADDYGRMPNSASKSFGNSGVRIACCKITQVVDTTNFGNFAE